MFLELLPVLYAIGHALYQDYGTLPQSSFAKPVEIVQIDEHDFWTDYSYQRYVGPSSSLSDISYIPHNLVTIESDYSLQAGAHMKLRQDVAIVLKQMSQALHAETGYPLVIVSAYRSYGQQKHINDVYGADTLRAKAGHSEHQLGLTVDVLGLTNESIENNPQHRTVYYRMVSNAHRYGFTQSYQKGPSIDGYERENWHWRYVGTDIAKVLSEQGITFTEYVETQKFRP